MYVKNNYRMEEMNNSYNYSTFTNLLVADFQKEKEIRRSEQINQENILTIDDFNNEIAYLNTKAEME